MLKRTEEMREQRYKERLNDYYRRNFKVRPGRRRAGWAHS
jgi:hypothetical protein